MWKNCKFFLFTIVVITFFSSFLSSFGSIYFYEGNNSYIGREKFIELDINDVLIMALINNPSIEIFTLKVKEAREKINHTFFYYWPDINLDLSYIIDNSKNFNKKENFSEYIIGANVSWLIFDTFKKRFLFAITDYDRQAAVETLESVKRDLLLSVSDIFYRTQFFREKIKSFIANENFYKRILNECKEKFKLGMCQLSEVINFEIRLNDAKILRFEEEEKYKISMLSLSSILGLSDSKFPYFIKLIKSYPINEKELETPKCQNLLKFIINRNPNVKISKLNLKKIYAKISINKTDRFPKMSFSCVLRSKDINKLQRYRDNFDTFFLFKISYGFFSKFKNSYKNKEIIEIKNECSKIIKKTFISEKTKIGKIFLELCYSQSQFLFQRENLNLIKQAKFFLEKEYKKNCISYVRLNEIQNEFVISCSKFYFFIFKLRQSLMEFRIMTEGFRFIK